MLAEAAHSSCDGNINEVENLKELHGINVWSKPQEDLENEALKELNIFTKCQSNKDLTDKELHTDEDTNNKNKSRSVREGTGCILDINLFIQRQEELRNRQIFKKSLDNSTVTTQKTNNTSKQPRKLKRKSKEDNEGNHNDKKIKLQNEENLKQEENDSDSEYVPSDLDSDYETEESHKKTRKIKSSNCQFTKHRPKVRDDGCLEYYNERLKEYHQKIENEPDNEYYGLTNGLKIPIKNWNKLYKYQQEGVKWLWEIHQKSTGGILGDEMGLGKTVQIITFLQALEYSGITSKHKTFMGCGPTLIVCPATVIYQWVEHFHEWAPEFRVVVFHQSGAFQGNKNKLLKDVNKNKGIVITTYSNLLKFKNNFFEFSWHYLILDEGHKIRNPNAKITKAVKQILTPHRIMLTGTPMQNNLQELWSCFDFTNPSMLGNLQTFMEHFANPIVQGGFTNATPMQEATALSIATTLKEMVSPFLLRRSKEEVQDTIHLPQKSEQILFCALTDEQRDLYKEYLMSDHIGSILSKDKKWYSDNQTKANILLGITTLKKICNHPNLYLTDEQGNNEGLDELNYFKKSGKMIVVSALLKIWKKQKHRVLLFTQGRAMITIFEEFLNQQGYKYLKMDGSTSIGSRQSLIHTFNEDNTYEVFLLTTRVGGLGINLTGADRVIIFDPDWNPATDIQARERAWRIGQDKQVTIYRLLSAGTIEEKMYQRQVWKQLLSNKVLLDPKTQKFFKSSSLFDLFSLPSDNEQDPETMNIFKQSRIKLEERLKEKKIKEKQLPEEKIQENQFSEEKIQQMKELAQKIAKSLSTPKKEVFKSSLQEDLESERLEKLTEKAELKKLSAMELLHLNRQKSKPKSDCDFNKVDDIDCTLGFDEALKYTEETAKLYKKVKSTKLIETIKIEKETRLEKIKKLNEKTTVDGEKVDGLVKKEIKKSKPESTSNCSRSSGGHDNYILEKLFSKKGISGALQHDEIVQSSNKVQSLRIRNDATAVADKALKALKNSRLNEWRW